MSVCSTSPDGPTSSVSSRMCHTGRRRLQWQQPSCAQHDPIRVPLAQLIAHAALVLGQLALGRRSSEHGFLQSSAHELGRGRVGPIAVSIRDRGARCDGLDNLTEPLVEFLTKIEVSRS